MIHIICIPIITVTLISLGIYYPLGEYTGTPYQAHAGLFIIFSFGAFYISLDFYSGLVAGIIYGSGYFIGNYLYLIDQNNHINNVLMLQAICWILQFIGHGLFESRRPALFDNILLTTSAPLFVVLELMMLFGYKTYLHDLMEKTKNQ